MKYSNEFDINTFEFWGGARDVAQAFCDAKRLDDLNQLIENAFYGMTPTATEINDFVWFTVAEIDDLEEQYGIKL